MADLTRREDTYEAAALFPSVVPRKSKHDESMAAPFRRTDGEVRRGGPEKEIGKKEGDSKDRQRADGKALMQVINPCPCFDSVTDSRCFEEGMAANCMDAVPVDATRPRRLAYAVGKLLVN